MQMLSLQRGHHSFWSSNLSPNMDIQPEILNPFQDLLLWVNFGITPRAEM